MKRRHVSKLNDFNDIDFVNLEPSHNHEQIQLKGKANSE
jgi:hypothetical protein